MPDYAGIADPIQEKELNWIICRIYVGQILTYYFAYREGQP